MGQLHYIQIYLVKTGSLSNFQKVKNPLCQNQLLYFTISSQGLMGGWKVNKKKKDGSCFSTTAFWCQSDGVVRNKTYCVSEGLWWLPSSFRPLIIAAHTVKLISVAASFSAVVLQQAAAHAMAVFTLENTSSLNPWEKPAFFCLHLNTVNPKHLNKLTAVWAQYALR